MPKCTNQTCIHNGSELPVEMFYKRAEKKSGVSSWCKDCAKLYSKSSSGNNKNDCLELAKAYNEKHKFVKSEEFCYKQREIHEKSAIVLSI